MKVRNLKQLVALSIVLSALVVTGCSSMKVYIDYDKSADFDAYETFQFVDHPDESMASSSPLLHDRLVNSIVQTFTDAGFRQVEDGADMMVTYYTSSDTEFRADTTYYGYGYPSPWHSYGYGYGGWGLGRLDGHHARLELRGGNPRGGCLGRREEVTTVAWCRQRRRTGQPGEGIEAARLGAGPHGDRVPEKDVAVFRGGSRPTGLSSYG